MHLHHKALGPSSEAVGLVQMEVARRACHTDQRRNFHPFHPEAVVVVEPHAEKDHRSSVVEAVHRIRHTGMAGSY